MKVSRMVDVRVSKWRVMNFITPNHSTRYSIEDQEVLLSVQPLIRFLLPTVADIRMNGKEDCRHKSPSLDSILVEMGLVFPLSPCFSLRKSFLTTQPTV